MNLSEFRSRIARVTGMSPTDTGDLALIDGWVNEGVVEFLKDTKVWQKTAALSVTAGSGDYTLDTDILALSDVWYSPAGQQNVILEPVDSLDIHRMRIADTSVDVATRFYALQGVHLLLLYPIPGPSGGVLHITYTPRPAAMSLTTHSPSEEVRGNIPPEYHSVIEAYAKWKAAEAEEHRPSEFGLTFQAEYAKGVAEVRSDMNRKAGVFKARKVGGKRRGRRYPLPRGVDNGA